MVAPKPPVCGGLTEATEVLAIPTVLPEGVIIIDLTPFPEIF
jgi:hypothetical protein